mmetsp:Transcript_15132/g.38229  ORF Transcript_15132/g.38229 Transcript_15132/m.38229 type:complete len:289 (-) Transcript_15132:340-1206(-)|eukprot:CAMPEP_0113891498 /NCGR_PEP_ID=MMETSP0780_2-20120614/14796_1 /TAXON_ID=652834 /ORGANISM="Palpitomonas bilix" /LENGTH=288 /DNA_ID=CAMNT_0000881135 /DNA_START=354 /DNA_END=1220 /DNA_ORIENTATION=+ /assembly_acc=CAM_ASM_000599
MSTRKKVPRIPSAPSFPVQGSKEVKNEGHIPPAAGLLEGAKESYEVKASTNVKLPLEPSTKRRVCAPTSNSSSSPNPSIRLNGTTAAVDDDDAVSMSDEWVEDVIEGDEKRKKAAEQEAMDKNQGKRANKDPAPEKRERKPRQFEVSSVEAAAKELDRVFAKKGAKIFDNGCREIMGFYCSCALEIFRAKSQKGKKACRANGNTLIRSIEKMLTAAVTSRYLVFLMKGKSSFCKKRWCHCVFKRLPALFNVRLAKKDQTRQFWITLLSPEKANLGANEAQAYDLISRN